MVYGEGKRSRLLATIGVTRGFGDHDLRAQSQNGPIYIKPFLSPQPEVRVLDIENEAIGEFDVLVMATDGLWDVVSNERVAEIVESGKGSDVYGSPTEVLTDYVPQGFECCPIEDLLTSALLLPIANEKMIPRVYVVFNVTGKHEGLVFFIFADFVIAPNKQYTTCCYYLKTTIGYPDFFVEA